MIPSDAPVSRRGHLALYGNARMVRAHCPDCGSTAFVLDGEFACCGRPADVLPTQVKRISEPVQQRRQPPAESRREILEAQAGRCLYCERSFGESIFVRGRWRTVRLHWDHLIPYAYSQDNRGQNFVAACNFCNLWKGSRLFQTLDEARVYLAGRWEDFLRD